jgi:hypothetical protein
VTCPLCKGSDTHKVIYMGFPMKLCGSNTCNCVWGFWSIVPLIFPINTFGYFSFMGYTGHYLPALWFWMTNFES